MASDKSEKITETYPVWLEGVMILDGSKNKVIKHNKCFSMPEHRGKVLPPFIVCRPRKISLIEEIIPRIDSIDLLRYRILHLRNTLKGNITRLDPDSLANVTLGNETLQPDEVLSLYFAQYIAFDKNIDEFTGDVTQRRSGINEIPSTIPYALRELTTQFIQEIQLLQQTFGAIQYDEAKADPDTQGKFEMYRNSDNTALRDYTKNLYTWIVRVNQVISSRLNDIDTFPNLLERYANELDTEDEDVKKFFLEERKKSRFEVYEDMIMTKEEKADFAQLLNMHVSAGQLDALDVQILKNVRNPKVAAARLRLMLMTKQKQQQDFEMQKMQENQNQNVVSAQVAAEEKRKTLELEYSLKSQLEKTKFENDYMLLQKQGEIKIMETANANQTKMQLEEFRKKFESDLTAFKKEQDRQIRLEGIDASAQNQQQLIKLRKGEIDNINEEPTQSIDLSTLNQ